MSEAFGESAAPAHGPAERPASAVARKIQII
jgi:hypothetical protein